MPAHDNERDVQLRRAVQSPGRFADLVRSRYLRACGRIPSAAGTLVDRPVAARIDHHHHATITSSTRWQPSFVVNASPAQPARPARTLAAPYRWNIPELGNADASRRRLHTVDVVTLTSHAHSTMPAEREPVRHDRAQRLPARAPQLEDVRALPVVRRSETVLARPHALAEEYRSAAAPTPHVTSSAGSPPAWPTAAAPGAGAAAVSPAEVDRITRQVISTIDQRLSAYRERQGRA